MALPEHYPSDESREIAKAVFGQSLENFEALSNADFQLIGTFVQLYNFLEFNLRRAVDSFAQAGFIEKPRYIRSADLVSFAKRAVAAMGLDKRDVDETLSYLDEIEYRRSFRNLLAHWAAKRVPGHDALIMLSQDDKDHERIFDHGKLSVGHCAYCIVVLADLRGLIQHMAEYERWLADKTAEWCQQYLERTLGK